ncbi:MAG: tetratricopeptide repeat protein [Thermodesulfobacteriota bacterium]
MENALHLFQNKKYQPAWEIIYNLKEDLLPPPRQADFFFLKGQVLRQLSKPLEAAQAFSRAAELHQLLADYALYYQAESWRNAGENQKSLETYQRLISSYPASLCTPLAELKMAEIYLQLKEYAHAKDICRRLLSRNLNRDQAPAALFLLAQAEEGLQEWVKAIQTYQEIWLKYPLHNLAAQAQEKWEKIARVKKIKIEKFSPALLVPRALHFYRARLYEKALKELEKIPGLSPTKFPPKYNGESWIDDFYFHRGMCLFYLKQYPKAKDIFQLVAHNSRNETIGQRSWLWMVRSLFRAGWKEQALSTISRFKNIFATSPFLDQILYLQAQILEDQGDTAQAISLYQEIGEKFPQSSLRFQALWQAGWLFFKNQDWLKANQVWEQLQAMNPNSPWIEKTYYWIGRAWQEMQEEERAENIFQYLRQNFPASYYSLLSAKKGNLSEINALFSAPLEEKNLPSFLEKYNGPSAPINLEKGKALARFGLPGDAISELAAAEEKGKISLEIQKEIARVYREIGEYARSTLLIRKNFRLRPLGDNIPQAERSVYLLAYPTGNLFWINYYAQIRNLDPALVCALILEESRFQQEALSVAGARGLMQILPTTGQQIARQLGLPFFEEKLLFEPDFNLRLGTWYLAHLLQEFSGKLPLALAAYNAGPQAVKEWASRLKNFRDDEFIESIPYIETRNYVIRVLNSFQAYRFLYRPSK